MMEEMIKQCCGKGGMPEPDKMKQFMESFGKMKVGGAEMEMIKQFCCKEGMPDPREMMSLMEKCGCYFPQTDKTDSAEGKA